MIRASQELAEFNGSNPSTVFTSCGRRHLLTPKRLSLPIYKMECKNIHSLNAGLSI